MSEEIAQRRPAYGTITRVDANALKAQFEALLRNEKPQPQKQRIGSNPFPKKDASAKKVPRIDTEKRSSHQEIVSSLLAGKRSPRKGARIRRGKPATAADVGKRIKTVQLPKAITLKSGNEQTLPKDDHLQQILNKLHEQKISKTDMFVAIEALRNYLDKTLELFQEHMVSSFAFDSKKPDDDNFEDYWKLDLIPQGVEILEYAGFKPLKKGNLNVFALEELDKQKLTNILILLGEEMRKIALEMKDFENSKKPKSLGCCNPTGKREFRDLFVPSARFEVGYADRRGRRRTMEDAMMVCGCFRNNLEEDYFGLFDGHGGSEASAFTALHFHELLWQKMSKLERQNKAGTSGGSGIGDECFKRIFGELCLELNQQMKNKQNTLKGRKIKSGTTVLVSLIIRERLYVVNLGDSRAVLCTITESGPAKALRLSVDHKPDLPTEKERIEAMGGRIMYACDGSSRLNGKIAVARSLGDLYDPHIAPFLSREPEVNIIDLQEHRKSGDLVLVLACDGVWDVLTDQSVADHVQKTIKDGPAKIADSLMNMSFEKGSTDNISVMVVAL
eukprot:TRINITY_DN5031_c0_g1_i1.p1 TRINITY_DN5031_c0_g1~~TRINITY_DN5031_c0_g1_i1.p1  ORF type:complete len:560 (+),score=114.03 TRINITY_DN5031_c0_g1_i1:84-1763(+)